MKTAIRTSRCCPRPDRSRCLRPYPHYRREASPRHQHCSHSGLPARWSERLRPL